MDEAPPPIKAIEIHGLTKQFGRSLALDHLSFEIPAGVIAGFVGPNGSGKTTTMRILATLLKPDSGSAKILGFDTGSGARLVRRSIGFVPDYFGLYGDMTPMEYLDFFGAAYRVPREKRSKLAEDLLLLLNLTDKRDTLIAGLSRGMQQKLSLGRALIHSPSVLLLDEPASGLDPRARIELMELLRELKSMGKTVFISSHILSELHELCDMVVIIDKGRMIYCGDVAVASENMDGGSAHLDLTIPGDPEKASAILKQIEGVKEIRYKGQILVIEHDPKVTSADLIEACVRQGIRIEEARKGKARLEDIFMRVTGQDG